MAKIEQAVASHNYLHYESTNIGEIRRMRFEINNLLRTAAALGIEPGRTLRSIVRTWIQRDKSLWHLYIGVPQGQINGRAPNSYDENPMNTTARLVTPIDVLDPTVETFGTLVNSNDTLMKMADWILSQPKHIRTIKIQFDPGPSADWFDHAFEDWSTTDITDDVLTAIRKEPNND